MDIIRCLIVFLIVPFLTPFQINQDSNEEIIAEKWKEVEIKLLSNAEYENPYTEVDVQILFRGPDDLELKRPTFTSFWK